MEECDKERNGEVRTWRKYQRVKGLHRRLPGGILSRRISEKEGKLKLEELHNQTCGVIEKVSLYRRM